MTFWQWWWIETGECEDGGWMGEFDTRDAAIAAAQRELPVGVQFDVMEARSSTSQQYEGADCVPFLRTRNRETLTNGPTNAVAA